MALFDPAPAELCLSVITVARWMRGLLAMPACRRCCPSCVIPYSRIRAAAPLRPRCPGARAAPARSCSPSCESVVEDTSLSGEAVALTVRCRAVHGSIGVISFFWQRTQQSTTLWPAMREWIAELGGIKSVWTALAWLVSLPTQYFEAADHRLLRESAHSVIALTYCLFGLRRPVELSQHAAVTTALGSVLGNMLPRDFAAGNADMWDVRVVFHAIAALCQLEYVMEPEHLNDMFYNVTSLQQLEGCTLAAHLHKPLLVFWPHLVAEMRRQHRCLQESTGESPPPGNGLPSLKVR